MLRLAAYVVFAVVPAIGALAYTINLAYVKFSKHHRQIVMAKLERKYKRTPFYEVRVAMYSTGSLVWWALITLIFMLGIVRDVF